MKRSKKTKKINPNLKVFQLNDTEWWMAETLEEAIKTAMGEYGTDCREDVYDGENPEPLTGEDLDRLNFRWGDGEKEFHSFRKELNKRIAAGCGVECFAVMEG